MIDVTVDDNGVIEALTASAATLHAEMQIRLWSLGERLQAAVKSHIGARPGPLSGTGRHDWRYIDSIGINADDDEGSYRVHVGTNLPYGRRLEFGFIGRVDKLGRTYNQPPYPHFRPAVAEILPAVEEEFGKLLDSVKARMT